eukprot:SAG11_NODE_1659_length_4500_cov_15.573279_1_plen_76_part_00
MPVKFDDRGAKRFPPKIDAEFQGGALRGSGFEAFSVRGDFRVAAGDLGRRRQNSKALCGFLWTSGFQRAHGGEVF